MFKEITNNMKKTTLILFVFLAMISQGQIVKNQEWVFTKKLTCNNTLYADSISIIGNAIGTATDDTLFLIVAGNNIGIIDTTNKNYGYGCAFPVVTTGHDLASVGHASMIKNTTGVYNSSLGSLSLNANTTGSSNTAVGYRSLYLNTSGLNNTAVGVTTLEANTTGSFLTALGVGALQHNTTGSENVAIGDYAMISNTQGGQNTAIGVGALYSNLVANNNTAVGYLALSGSVGINNTAIGTATGATLQAGDYNTLIGLQADVAADSTTNAIALGANATAKSNQFALPSTITSVKLGTLPEYADDAAAGAGGLVAGELYQTTTGGSSFVKIKQ